MIDSLNLKLDNSTAGDVDLLSEVPRYLDDSPQEHYYPYNDGSGGKYLVLCGHVGSLRVSISRLSVSIKDSSFCKWILGDNFKTLTRGDIQRGFEKLSDSLHLPMHKAKVTRLDIGQNTVLKYPTDVYFRHLGPLKYTKRLQQPSGLYYTGTNMQLVFYDKVREQRKDGNNIPELYKGQNVLRYEIRFLRRLPNILNVEAVTGGLLYDESFYISLVKKWHGCYMEIKKINDVNLNFDKLTTKKDLYKAGLLTLIEQRGGQMEILKEIREAARKGELTQKQAHDLRDAVNNACKVRGELVKPNMTIKELDRKINDAAKYYR